MDRRKVLQSGGVLGASVAAATIAAVSQAAFAKDHKKSGKNKQSGPFSGDQINSLTAALLDCKSKADICVAHCQRELARGDNMLGECLKGTLEVVPVVAASSTIVAYNSELSKPLLKVCLEACEFCAEACKKHADHHEECKTCYESCKACIKEIKKVLG